jgi:hypothetical protein
MRLEGHVVGMKRKNACRILVGKPEEKKQLGRHRRRGKDNITMDLGEIRWGGMSWTETSGGLL